MVGVGAPCHPEARTVLLGGGADFGYRLLSKGYHTMKRLLSLSILALVGLSACDSESVVSPLAPETPAASFAKVEFPEFEPPEVCPVESCILEPANIIREKKSPTRWSEEFTADEGQEAELVLYSSNPRTTTLKAWLNGEVVLLPSALPKSKLDQIRVPLVLAEENALELRLSAKPGTRVVFWIEGVEVDEEPEEPEEPELPPEEPAVEYAFQTSGSSVPPTADMSAACPADYTVADWDDVVAAMDGGMVKDEILTFGDAFIFNNGLGVSSTSMFLGTYHFSIAASGTSGPQYEVYGTDFVLTDSNTPLQVLCVRISS